MLPSLLKGGEPSLSAAVLNVGYILEFWGAITRKRVRESGKSSFNLLKILSQVEEDIGKLERTVTRWLPY